MRLDENSRISYGKTHSFYTQLDLHTLPMATSDSPKHRLTINEKGRVEQEGFLVEVHSRGGSLFGLKILIDEVSKRQSLDIRTLYDNKMGAGYLAVIFAENNASEAAEKLDDFLSHRDEFQILGYFSDAVEAAITLTLR